jgi:hypothetical protein
VTEVVQKAKRVLLFSIMLFILTAGCAGVVWLVWFIFFRKNTMNIAYQERRMLREYGRE